MISKSTDKKVFYVYGGTDTKTREDIRAITEKEDNAVIVASYGTFSTGINIRNLHNIVFSSPSVRVELEHCNQLEEACVGVIIKIPPPSTISADDFTHKSKKNFTINHFQQRINIYAEEQFDYDITRIKLK